MYFNIGANIRALRRRSSASQSELAEYLCVKPQSVSKWERGVSEPDIALLPEIALFFGVGVDELFIPNTYGDEKEALSALDILCEKGEWLEMAENALLYARKFPRDARICERLLLALVQAETCGKHISGRDSVFAVNLAKRIINECADAALKERLIYHLCVILYKNGRILEGDFYYSSMPSAAYCRESLDMYKYKGRELIDRLKANNAAWYNMLAQSYCRMAYNIDASEESIGLLRKAYECFCEAYDNCKMSGYLRMCVLMLLDISITYEMIKRRTEAEKSFRTARNFAYGHDMGEYFDELTKKALESSDFSPAGKCLYERMRAENV